MHISRAPRVPYALHEEGGGAGQPPADSKDSGADRNSGKKGGADGPAAHGNGAASLGGGAAAISIVSPALLGGDFAYEVRLSAWQDGFPSGGVDCGRADGNERGQGRKSG